MKNYVVAYLCEQRNYNVRFVVANDILQACTKVIPRFNQLLESLHNQSIPVDYTTLCQYSNQFGIILFNAVECPLDTTIRMQVVVAHDTTRETLSIYLQREAKKVDALAVTCMNLGFYNDELEHLRCSGDIKHFIMVYAHYTNIRVYSVSTLKSLIKEGLQ